MPPLGPARTCFLVCALVLKSASMPASSQADSNEPKHQTQKASAGDGQHDFDFEIGSWKTHIRRLAQPLTGSTTWVDYEGTTVVRKVWNGRANLVEVEADAPGSH